MNSEKKIPAISVIIPMYNVEKYIEMTLNSVFSQTFRDFELIVVDDHSSDHSVEIVERFVKNIGEGGGDASYQAALELRHGFNPSQ